ncbi:MAG: hypothetical protein ACI92O_000505 [Colwellia sp.]|jgi:hypothetical protein
MKSYVSFILLIILSPTILAKSLHMNIDQIAVNESLNIDVVNSSLDKANLKVTYPEGKSIAIAEIFPQNRSIITFTPVTVGQYVFNVNNESHILWAHKKPSINIKMSKVFVPNMPIDFHISQDDQDKNYQYDWQIFYKDKETYKSSEASFTFLPPLKGNYSLRLNVIDNRVPPSNLSTTTIYRTFEVKDRIDIFSLNLPNILYRDELPIHATVLRPFSNGFKVRWYIEGSDTPLENLIITESMFKEHSLNILVQVYNGEGIFVEKSTVINLENSRLKTGYISVEELPSGNIEIRSDGDGLLSIVDQEILKNILVITDTYIVIKPIINHPFDVLLIHEDKVLDKYIFDNAIEHYTFDFNVTFLTDENVMPSFIKFSISDINVTTENIDRISFYLNEKEMVSTKLEATAYSDLIGINTARIEMVLKTGEIIIKAKKFTLSSSTSPVCSIEYDNRLNEVWARCTDTDSYIKHYVYSIDGVTISDRNSFTLPNHYDGEIIMFEAIDALGNSAHWVFKVLSGKIIYVQQI